MTEFGGGSGKYHQDHTNETLVNQSPKRPWSAPRVILSSDVMDSAKTIHTTPFDHHVVAVLSSELNGLS